MTKDLLMMMMTNIAMYIRWPYQKRAIFDLADIDWPDSTVLITKLMHQHELSDL